MLSVARDAERRNAQRSKARVRDTCTTHFVDAHVHVSCTAVPFLPRVILSCACVCPAIPPVPRLCPSASDRMFSKDTLFQVSLSSVPGEHRGPIKARSLDQPGILVAFTEDVLEDGDTTRIYGGTTLLGTFTGGAGTCSIPIARLVLYVLIVGLAVQLNVILITFRTPTKLRSPSKSWVVAVERDSLP